MSETPQAHQILAGLPDAVLTVDGNNQIGEINPAAENLFRTSARNLERQTLQSVLRFDSERLNEVLHDPHANLVAHNVSAHLRGHAIPIDFSIGTLPTVPQWRIVSIRAKLENMGSNTDGQSSGNQLGVGAPDVLGHEIKNPLAAIRGAAQLLARKSDENGKKHTGMIISEVDRIARLIERMQSLSTNQPAKVRAINIHSLIDQVRKSIESGARYPVSITDNFDPSLPDVLADPDAMIQILTNLFSNAMTAVGAQENPKVDIITRFSFGGMISTKDENRPVKLPIEVIVQDNGPGVPKSMKNDIFAPFITTKPEGQGLGLALVKKLVEDMNGRVKYDRKADAGLTRFTLFLPMAEQSKQL
ncbi:MAG: ATP-binding protein [Parasphingorhabdus sp.]